MSAINTPFLNNEKTFEISKINHLHLHISKYQQQDKELLYCSIKCETLKHGTVMMQGTLTKLEYQV